MSKTSPIQLPAWIAMMRAAAADAVSTDDIRAMVQKQVELAKGGDKEAFKLVMDYLMGGKTPDTAVQNNFYLNGGDGPTTAKPGTPDKVKVMQARVSAGLPVDRNGDSGFA